MPLIRDNVACLRQGLALLEELDDELYLCAPPGLEAGGVGAQLRHVIDYYDSFLRDVRGGRVDYDRRERSPELETSREAATAALRRLVVALEALRADLAAPLLVKADGDPAAPPSQLFHPTSVARELMFLASHTIHHFALIALTLRGHGFTTGPDFGVAPSTLRYWQSHADPTR